MFSAQDFAARLAKREDRWSLLKDFVAEWHSPLQPGDGYSTAELDAVEERLGLKLPAALREWYQIAGHRKDIIAAQNFLRSPDRLYTREEDSGNVLYFYTENQAVVNWGILASDLELYDPPVYLDEIGAIENQTLSEFVTQMVVFETTCFGGAFGGNSSANLEALEIVKQNFIPLGFPDWHWSDSCSRLYGGNGVLIETEASENGYCWIWIGAQTRGALRDTAQLFSLDWECLNLNESYEENTQTHGREGLLRH